MSEPRFKFKFQVKSATGGESHGRESVRVEIVQQLPIAPSASVVRAMAHSGADAV